MIFLYIPTYLKFIPMVNVIVHFEILFAYNCIGGCFLFILKLLRSDNTEINCTTLRYDIFVFKNWYCISEVNLAGCMLFESLFKLLCRSRNYKYLMNILTSELTLYYINLLPSS